MSPSLSFGGSTFTVSAFFTIEIYWEGARRFPAAFFSWLLAWWIDICGCRHSSWRHQTSWRINRSNAHASCLVTLKLQT